MPSLLPSLKVRVSSVISGVVAASAERSAEHLTEETPVDTGLAQSNWIFGIGVPPAYALASLNPGNALGMRLAVVAHYDFHSGPLVLTNNVEYTGQLNLGYALDEHGMWLHGSDQQPFYGWMELAVEKGLAEPVL